MTLLATLACIAGAWLAWSWSPVLVAGTPLGDLNTLVRFGAVLAFLTLAQQAAKRLFERDH